MRDKIRKPGFMSQSGSGEQPRREGESEVGDGVARLHILKQTEAEFDLLNL